MCISLPSNKKGYSYLHITSCKHGRLTPCTYSSIGNRVWHPGRARLLHSLGNQTPIRVWLITQDGCDSPHPLTGCGLHVPLLGILGVAAQLPIRMWLITLLEWLPHPKQGVAAASTWVPICPFQGFPNCPSQGFPNCPSQGFPNCPFQGFPNCPFQGFPNCPFQGTTPSQGFSQLPFSG